MLVPVRAIPKAVLDEVYGGAEAHELVRSQLAAARIDLAALDKQLAGATPADRGRLQRLPRDGLGRFVDTLDKRVLFRKPLMRTTVLGALLAANIAIFLIFLASRWENRRTGGARNSNCQQDVLAAAAAAATATAAAAATSDQSLSAGEERLTMGDCLRLRAFPANEGDCLLIEYGDSDRPHRVLIDGGRTSATYRDHLGPFLADLKDGQRELEAHGREPSSIATTSKGRWPCCRTPNSPSPPTTSGSMPFPIWRASRSRLVLPENPDPVLSAKHGELLTAAIRQRKWPWNKAFGGAPVALGNDGKPVRRQLAGGAIIHLLSPSREKLAALIPAWRKECARAEIVPGLLAVAGAEVRPARLPCWRRGTRPTWKPSPTARRPTTPRPPTARASRSCSNMAAGACCWQPMPTPGCCSTDCAPMMAVRR